MCEFTGNYKDSKLLKRGMNKLAEEETTRIGESRRATHNGFELKYRLHLKNVYFFPFFI